MKKLLVCAVLAALLPAALFAVDLSAGAKGGVNLAVYGGQDWKDFVDFFGFNNGMRLGFSGAVFLNIGVNDSISIQPEVGYSLLGGKLSDDFGGVQKYYMNAIEIPILIMPKFASGAGILGVFAGPDLFYILGDATTKQYLDGEFDDEWDSPIDNSLLIGFAVGIQYLRPLGGGNLVFDAKYSQVVTKIYDDFKQYPNAINVRIGYAVQL